MTQPHKSIEAIEDIPDICSMQFLTKEKMLGWLWVLVLTVMATAGTCVAWAMTVNTSITELTQSQIYQDSKIQYLQDEINKKLDILLKR